MIDFQAVKRNYSVSEVVGKHVQLKRSGSGFQGLCPFHNEKSPSFTVDDAKGFFHCFGCGEHGDVIDFIEALLSVDKIEAVEIITGQKADAFKVDGNHKRTDKYLSVNTSRKPKDHAQDHDRASAAFSKMVKRGMFYVKQSDDSAMYLPVINKHGVIINLAKLSGFSEFEFIAGGLSYYGYSMIEPSEFNGEVCATYDYDLAMKLVKSGSIVVFTYNLQNTRLLHEDGTLEHAGIYALNQDDKEYIEYIKDGNTNVYKL